MLKKILAVICAIALILSLSVTAYAAEAPIGHNGWWTDEDNGNVYYYVDGEKQSGGIFVIEDNKYYFDWSGALQTGVVSADGQSWYLTDESGAIVTDIIGWYPVVDEMGFEHTYYFYEDGSIARNEFFTIGGNTYYCDYQGYLANNGGFTIWDDVNQEQIAYLALYDGSIVKQQGWYLFYDTNLQRNCWYYIEGSDGRLALGIRELGGQLYNFEYDGRMTESSAFSVYDEQNDRFVYHYANSEGHVITKAGWYKEVITHTYEHYTDVQTYWYYVKNSDLYEIAVEEFLTIDGNTYYFDTWGRMQIGTFNVYNNETDEFKNYVADYNGVVRLSKGWHKLKTRPDSSDEWFYIYDDGTYAYNCIEVINGRKYAFDDWGNLIVGMFEMEGKIYHTDDSTAIFDIPSQWFMYEDNWYYIKADGELAREEALDVYGNGNIYVFDYYGTMRVGYCSTEDATYYTDDSGIALKNQWIKDGPVWYLAKADGTLTANEWWGNYFFDYSGAMCVGVAETDEAWGYCCFDSNGVYQYKIGAAAGWHYADGSWFYYSSPNEPYNGWLQSGGNWYYILDGLMLTNRTVAPEVYDENYDGDYEDATRYYLNHQGIMQTGWILSPYGNVWLYANPDGIIATGWQQINGIWYYFDSDGCMYNNEVTFLYDEEKWSSFAESGAWLGYLNDGWYLDKEGSWYYFNGSETIHGEYTVGTATYYFYNSRMLANEAFTDQGIYIDANGFVDNGSGWRLDVYENWYYLENGVLADGLKLINGAWYYFRPYMVTGYTEYFDSTIDEYQYGYFNDSGAWQPIGTGWYSVNLYEGYTEWYYFVDGKAPSKQYTYWYNVGGSEYLFNNGRMIQRDYWADNNEIYLFDTNGHLLSNQWVLYDGDIWYYADSTGRALKGEHNIGGTTYYFTTQGVWFK